VLVLRNYVSHQSLQFSGCAASHVIPSYDNVLAYCRVPAQYGLDLLWLDTHTADLDLVI
jgi:hypothetical protein